MSVNMITQKIILKKFDQEELKHWREQAEKHIKALQKKKTLEELEALSFHYQVKISQLEKKLGNKLLYPLNPKEEDSIQFVKIHIQYETLKKIILIERQEKASIPTTTQTINSNSNAIAEEIDEDEMFQFDVEEVNSFRKETRETILKKLEGKAPIELKQMLITNKKNYQTFKDHLISKKPKVTILELLTYYFQYQFEIDLLEQYLFRKILTIEEQEQIRAEIFKSKDEDISNLIKELCHVKVSPPTILREKIHYYCKYKYLIEFFEQQMEIYSKLPFIKRQKILHSIENAGYSSTVLSEQIELIENATENPNEDLCRCILGNEYNAENPLDTEKLCDFFYLYSLVYYKTSLKQDDEEDLIHKAAATFLTRATTNFDLQQLSNNNNNNAGTIPYGKNPNGFHHHSEKELTEKEQIEQLLNQERELDNNKMQCS